MKKAIFVILCSVTAAIALSAVSDFVLKEGDNFVYNTFRIVGMNVMSTNGNNTATVCEVSMVNGKQLTNTLYSLSVSGNCTNAALPAKYICRDSKIVCSGSAFTNGTVRLFSEL